jgi:hypothetical protein
VKSSSLSDPLSSSLSSPLWRVLKQEFDAVVSKLWRSQAQAQPTYPQTKWSGTFDRLQVGPRRFQRLPQLLDHHRHNDRTRLVRPATLVQVTGLGLGVSLFLWDWHVGVGLAVAGLSLTTLMRLSPGERKRLWRHLCRIYATQPLLVLGAAFVLALCLADASELPLWLGVGALLGFGAGKLKQANLEGLSPQDCQVWVQELASPDSLQRLVAIQHIQTWVEQGPLTLQQSRFLIRALQLRLQQEPEPIVQQAIEEALTELPSVLSPSSSAASTPVCQLPAAFQEPLAVPLAVVVSQKRRPPDYQSQLSASLQEAPQHQHHP